MAYLLKCLGINILAFGDKFFVNKLPRYFPRSSYTFVCA